MVYNKSPMNYIGNKYKLLPEILPRFPKKIDSFVDLFCGGCDVTINVEADEYLANDISIPITDLYWFLALTSNKEELFKEIETKIKLFGLSKDDDTGYYELREAYNKTKDSLLLLILIAHTFNNQVRFNSSDEFNNPSGRTRSHFNDKMKKNLSKFIDIVYEREVVFSGLDFRQVELYSVDFVYADPPYSITDAAYNSRWTEKDDDDLLYVLSSFGGQFALSNAFESKGRKNQKLIDWAQQYNVIYINKQYSNANYRRKFKNDTQEVLITNY